MTHRSTIVTLGAAGALALGLTGASAAAPSPAAELGQHIAGCAQEHLGQREAVPGVACAHDGTTMSFENFGAMVQHMKEHHG